VRAGRVERTASAASRLWCECRRALEERGDRRHSTASPRPAGGALEFRRKVLVGHGRSLGSVPRSPVRVELWIGCLRKRAMDGSPLLQPGCPIHGGANQRVAEHHASAQLDQAFGLDRFGGRLGDAQVLGRTPEQRRITNWLRGGGEQEAARVPRKACQPPREALLDAGGQRNGRRQAEAAGQLRRRQPAWQLEQRERIPVRFGDDAIEHVLIQATRQHRFQEASRMQMAKGLDSKLRPSGEVARRLATGEHERDFLGQ